MTESGLKQRRHSRKITVGSLEIGGDSNVSVQSMTNTDTRNTHATLTQIFSAAAAGADLMRVSVPDMTAARSLHEIVKQSPVPIAADIHFDHRLALRSLEAGIHKLRLNPGNIGGKNKVREVVVEAKARRVPIRIGVNSGSLEADILQQFKHPTPEAMAESALRHAAMLLDMDFSDIILSIKGSDVLKTVMAYRIVADRCDLPLHVGITESGTLLTGAVRSAIGISLILAEGIGDTIRVSLAADPVEEIRVAYRILDSLQIRRRAPVVLACPTCSRTQIDIITLADQIEKELQTRMVPLTVAVMGCAVNGPGEAREADLGIAGGRGEAILFRKGKPIRKVKESQIIQAVLALFDEVASGEYSQSE